MVLLDVSHAGPLPNRWTRSDQCAGSMAMWLLPLKVEVVDRRCASQLLYNYRRFPEKLLSGGPRPCRLPLPEVHTQMICRMS